MQFNTFAWPNDPATFSVKMQRDAAVHTLLDGTWCVQELGHSPRSFTGEGVFYGESAYASFNALRGLFLAGGSGALLHPQWGKLTVCLTELASVEEPAENLVRYRFTFLESGEEEAEV